MKNLWHPGYQQLIAAGNFHIFYLRFHNWKNDWTVKSLSSQVNARKGTIFESRWLVDEELWFGDMVDALANRMPDLHKRELPASLTFQQISSM